jgi:alpha-mannosidase
VDGSSQARVGEHLVEVQTDMEVRADDSTVRVATSFVNPSGDHRLRVHLPLPEPATESHAESAFTVVTRGLTAEGRVDELGLPTAPAERFVTAGRLTVAHEGVCEYELIDFEDDAARTLALTVLRSTGMLSRMGMAYRPFPAGPMTPVEGLQMRGKRVTLRYALALDCDDPYSLADDVLLPLETTASLGGGTRPPSGSELTVHGAEVSALQRVGGVLELRVFNPRPEATEVSVPGRTGWLVDLRGFPTEPFEGSFELRPFGVATARLRGD